MREDYMRMRCGGRGKKSWKRISLSLSLSLQAPSWVRQWHQQVQPLLGPVSLSWTVPTLTLLSQWQPPSCLNLAITSAGEVSMSNTSTKIIQRWTRQDFVTDILAIPSSTDLLRVTTVYTLGRFWTGKAKMIFGNWWVENTAERCDKGNQQTDKLSWCSRWRQQTVLARLLCTWPPTTAVGTCSTYCSTAGQTRHTGTRSGRHVTRERYICIQLGWGPSHYAHRWAQPTNIKISLGLKPRPPALNSSAFTFRRIRYGENILQL